MIDWPPFIMLKTTTLAFAALFPIVNPLGDAPIFLNMTRQYPPSVHKLLARKVAIYGFLMLTVSLLFGTDLLVFFGLSIPAVQLAGGLVLAITGWQLLSQTDTTGGPQEQQANLDDAMRHAFYPLTLPLTVGPGCISVAITIGAHLRQKIGARYIFDLPLFLAAMLGMGLVCVLVWLCYGNADRLVKKLGSTGTSIVTRLSSFILLAIGFQIMWNGMSSALEPLLTRAAAH
jgi:multiple antibiotic resistance protein